MDGVGVGKVSILIMISFFCSFGALNRAVDAFAIGPLKNNTRVHCQKQLSVARNYINLSNAIAPTIRSFLLIYWVNKCNFNIIVQWNIVGNALSRDCRCYSAQTWVPAWYMRMVRALWIKRENSVGYFYCIKT